MYGNDNLNNWLPSPSRPDMFLFSTFDIYLPSSETETYGMTNGSCPRVLCWQQLCRRFEYSSIVVRGSVTDSAMIIENICS